MNRLIVAASLFAFTLPLTAQLETPRISQRASVIQTIGTTDIEIEYHRPGVKNRQIWGELVPYGQPWRMGANEATTISFSDPVTIEGKELPAGKYSLFAIPESDRWTLVINSDPNQWGAYGYDQAKDALRFAVRPVPAPHTEWMRFTIDPKTPDTAVITLAWDKVEVPFEVEVDVSALVWSEVDETFASTWDTAANWSLESGERLEDGLRWIDQSIAVSGEGVFNLWTKARLLHRLGRSSEAVPVMEKALAMAEGNVPADFMNVLRGTMSSIREAAN